MTRAEWEKARLKGIGASDAAAILGLSPYMTNERLWEIKTGHRAQEDISSKPYVEYGTKAEQHIRGLFALDYPRYMVEYQDFDVVQHPAYPFLFATLDGRLLEMDDSETVRLIKRRGVLEIKTTEIFQPTQWDKWDNRIPDNYYAQVIHQLLVTGWPFAVLRAQIKWRKNGVLNITTRDYTIEAADVSGEIDFLLQEEIKFWELVRKKQRPNAILPSI